MKRLITLFILTLSMAVTAQHQLGYNLSVGDTFVIEQEAKQHITQDISGVSQIIENHLVGKMQFEVTESNADTFTITMAFKRLKMLMNSPTLGELSNIDSNDIDSTDVTSMMFRGILNIPITMVMDKMGKIKSVTGGDKLIASMFSAANITQPEIIEASTEQLNKQFGSEALSTSFEQMTRFYPEKSVAVGDEWKNTYSGDLSSVNNWTLVEHTPDILKISGTATTTMSNIDESIMMTLTGSQKTTIVANSKTGLFQEIVVTGENEGSTLFQAQNMTIPTKIKSTITYKISQ